MLGRDPAPPPMGNIQQNFLAFNCQAKDKFLEWRYFHFGGENIFIGPYAAMEEKEMAALDINWMGCDGSELVNSCKIATRGTGKESLKNICGAVEQIIKHASSVLFSWYQFRKLSHKKGHIMNQWMAVLQTQANLCNFGTSIIEHIHEQFMVGIKENKIRVILLCDVKDTSTQDEVIGIAYHIESQRLQHNVLSNESKNSTL